MSFPIFKGNILPKVKELVEAKTEFVLVEKDDFFVVDYHVNFSDTFPPLSEPDADWYREFRGLILSKDGHVVRRPFHKFFNYGENPEHAENQYSLANHHVICDKLDGSMIAPFILDGKIIWATKIAAQEFHEKVKAFVEKEEGSKHYNPFIAYCNKDKLTPIFEYVAPTNKIVVSYKNEGLILTAVRHIETGEYMDYANMSGLAKIFNIPVVDVLKNSFDNLDKLKNHTSILEGVEGFVVAFTNGNRIKIKGDWYCALHKVRSYFDYEKDIVQLILDNKLDDLLSILNPDERNRIEIYEKALNNYIEDLTNKMFSMVSLIRLQNLDKKTYALSFKDKRNPIESQIIFKIWDDLENHNPSTIKKLIIDSIMNINTHGKWSTFKQINKSMFVDDLKY